MSREENAERNPSSVHPSRPSSPQPSSNPTRNDASNAQNAQERHFFGMKANKNFPPQDPDDDYEKRFPEDPFGEETGPNARVWRTYVVESAAFDENLVKEARDGLDAMLVFAGLFSAVITSFLVQSSQWLQVDYTKTSASLLSELIAVQRAAASGVSVDAVPASQLNLATELSPETYVVLVNGLWLISLILSLVVAVGSVLVKQWLHWYIAPASGTPRDRSLVRQFKLDGLKKCHVLSIIDSLPMVMHISLFSFLSGLLLFLTQFPLVYTIIETIIILVIMSVIALIMLTVLTNLDPVSSVLAAGQRFQSSLLVCFLPVHLSTRSQTFRAAQQDDKNLVRALLWLYNASDNLSVQSVAVQAISGLPVQVAAKVRDWFADLDIRSVYESLLESCTLQKDSKRCATPGLETRVERLIRGSLLSKASPEPGFDAEGGSCGFEDMAAYYAATRGWMYESEGEIKSFILANHRIPHHPLVWMLIVRGAMECNAFSDYQHNSTVLKILLSALDFHDHASVAPPHPRVNADSSSMVETVRSYYQQSLCEHLLSMSKLTALAVKDHAGRIPQKPRQLLVETMEYTLTSVRSEPSNLQSVHWEVLGVAFNVYSEHDWSSHPMMSGYYANFAVSLIEHTDICDSHPQGPKTILDLREQVLTFYHSYLTSHDEGQVLLSKFSLLRRALEGTIRDMPYHQSEIVHESLIFGLREGCTTAVDLVVECNYLELLWKCEETIFASARAAEVVLAIIDVSLPSSKLIELAVKDSCVNYLYETRNLGLGFLSLMIEHGEGAINKLVSLRPEQNTWKDCREWSARISEWISDNADALKSKDIPPELGEEWMRRCFQTVSKDPISIQKLDVFIALLDEVFATGEYKPLETSVQTPPRPAALENLAPGSITIPEPAASNQTRRKPMWNFDRIPRMFGWRNPSPNSIPDIELGERAYSVGYHCQVVNSK